MDNIKGPTAAFTTFSPFESTLARKAKWLVLKLAPRNAAKVREQEFLHLRVGLTASDGRIHLDEHQLRDADPKTSSHLTHDDLGHQRLAPLAGAGELDHVGAEIACFDQPGQRTSLR